MGAARPFTVDDIGHGEDKEDAPCGNLIVRIISTIEKESVHAKWNKCDARYRQGIGSNE